jgi:MtN3 and saliva related transmembrane protein
MEFHWTEYIGFVAGALTTGAYLPQVWKTWRSKAVDDISLAMCWALFLGIGLWLVYGLCIGAWAVIAANAACLALVAALLRMKLKYGRPGPAAPPGRAPPRPAA